MITREFRESVEKGLGGVVILAGSGSDEAHIDKLAENLLRYGLAFEVRVASEHKQSELVTELITAYDSLDGPLAYITVAGGVDALSGRASFYSKNPVISCPPDHPNLTGIGNPSLSSNAYVGRPDNAARFVAQMFSFITSGYATAVREKSLEKIGNLEGEDSKLQGKYAEMQGKVA
ncbi:MAG: AIR carboxylase family protein [Nanoarchaeota archaeon]